MRTTPLQPQKKAQLFFVFQTKASQVDKPSRLYIYKVSTLLQVTSTKIKFLMFEHLFPFGKVKSEFPRPRHQHSFRFERPRQVFKDQVFQTRIALMLRKRKFLIFALYKE